MKEATINTEPAARAPANGEGAPASPPDPLTQARAELQESRQLLAAAEAKAKENLDGWQRERAEFSNYRRRQESELRNVRSLSATGLISKLLPIIDDFDRAARTLPAALAGMTWIEGVMLIQRKLQVVVESEGVKVVEVKQGDPFDPTQHEAISHDEAAGVESGRVIEELQRGYRLGDKVLRPALVRVAK